MNKKTLKEIYKRYDLTKDDIFLLPFGDKSKYVICRTGIEKIQAKLNIQINYKLEKCSDDHKSVIVLATGVVFESMTAVNGQPPKPKHVVSSFGECNPSNNKNSFSVCMAEKRAKSRVVLQISGLYKLNIYSEDESEDFRR
tara:strand:+ start:837 stop:1259 length:423 start_codon:yes stop_codon:yes gene_type:complete